MGDGRKGLAGQCGAWFAVSVAAARSPPIFLCDTTENDIPGAADPRGHLCEHPERNQRGADSAGALARANLKQRWPKLS